MKVFPLAVVASLLGLCAQSVPAGPNDIYVGGAKQEVIFRFNSTGFPVSQNTFATGIMPLAMTFSPSGNLFVADGITLTIKKFTPAGVRSTFATDIKAKGLAFDPAGNLFVSIAETNAPLFKFSPDGTRKVFVSGLNHAEGLAVDTAGNLYVGYPELHAILKFAPDGTRTTFASGIEHPRALAFDSFGNLYVTDVATETLFLVTPSAIVFVATGFTDLRGVAVLGSNLVVTDGERVLTLPASDPEMSTVIGQIAGGANQVAIEPPAIVNISTRAEMQTGDHVSIGGFIISGTEAKTVLIRALGPSLGSFGVGGALADPTLELHDGPGHVIATNDNWQDAANASLIPPGFAPASAFEAAILITLQPGSYTAIEAGKSGTTGVGLIEVFDLSPNSNSQITNISTRGLVQSGNGVMIGGLVVQAGAGGRQVLVRGLGPSLSGFGISDPLPDPTLSLFDGNGALIASNDNWKTFVQSDIAATGLAPTNDLESAILTTLFAGNYTAIVSDKNGATGVGMVEIFTAP